VCTTIISWKAVFLPEQVCEDKASSSSQLQKRRVEKYVFEYFSFDNVKIFLLKKISKNDKN
jgi:hypothetical protein